ncbi:HAMP domain-containing sensor histidine kinase [Bacillus swezeyi]|uniref:histidine kinase n=1 Tax=Bacillus swezeyi TaxID=1925020 RepID=A0A1R1QR59_9BACI|nr:HAMP domain-containing sensor histidine kinase [Bacillus swezeyi]MEC1259047.1 HAMP domain-containing sensor histidine kinase [Bacillus swezeyi]MED2927992.1 HAMP domain-containing sensor histidine kinase [Bacillus swezeyi]MED2965096.1 HAMP domain-containing sensor histidine kinase [Bacillus swezeyi]MED3071357.1 HAMP domain-containing sensor histidine kinase [Bacillus swezeyi]MED3081005.1 HAMP domain-containing sensor histidine kinase [Bacillus swezeyi]
MKLRERIAFHFISRIILLIVICIALFIISTLFFTFFLNDKETHRSPLSLSSVVRQTSLKDGKISIEDDTISHLKQYNMWLQILDEEGNELYSYQKPHNIPKHYIPGELVSDYVYPAKKGFHLSTWFDTKENQTLTWILGEPFKADNPFLYWTNQLWILSMIVMGIIVALYFGKQLGAPLLYIVSWIENLSKGTYAEPVFSSFIPKKKKKPGYKLYQELMNAMSNLTLILQKNKAESEKLEQTREEWMTGVSHDLKTPLSVIKGYTILLSSEKHEWNQEKVRDFANIMQERVEYMEELIEEFNLTFRLKNDALPIQKEEKDIVGLLRETLSGLKSIPESQDKHFDFQSNKSAIAFYMDEKYMQRALENLIANSIKHNPPDTKIKVSILHEPHHVTILIEDDGIGMEKETLEHLFDRYYRGTNASSNTSGTGLGMTIARQIIYAHEGDIDIFSEPGRGTQIKIMFQTKTGGKAPYR